MIARPDPISQRAETRDVRLPETAATTNAASDKRQEPEPGGERRVAEDVLEVEREIEEGGEDRRRDRERRDLRPHEARPAKQPEVEHGIAARELDRDEHRHEHDRSDEAEPRISGLDQPFSFPCSSP